MEVQRGSPIGDRLIDGAILLLVLLLAAWAAALFTASGSRQRETGGDGSGGTPSNAPVEPVRDAHRLDRAGWNLVWHDEFSGAACPSRAKWSFENGFLRNGELQWYQPQNAFCRDGFLVLEARREERPNPAYRPGSRNWTLSRHAADYTSASIASKYSFTYGRVEALMRIDPGQGSWPSFWTLGTGYRADRRAWPATGEVDIMEAYRNLVLANVCNPKPTWCRWSSTRQSVDDLGGQAWKDRFHVWAMDWNARRIDLFLDGKRVHRFAVAEATRRGRRNPYIRQPAYLLLSEAIGGANGGHPANAAFPFQLEVGYVRVYQRARDESPRALN